MPNSFTSRSTAVSKRWHVLLGRLGSHLGMHHEQVFRHLHHHSQTSSEESVGSSGTLPQVPPSPPLYLNMAEYLSLERSQHETDERDAIDELRASAYTRLGEQVYVDYMGGCLLPETL